MQKEDTLWRPVKMPPEITRNDTLNPRVFKLTYPWQYGTSYKMTVDSLAATSIYGLFNKGLDYEFTVKKQEDYSNLRFVLSSLPDSVPMFVELLNRSDEPIRAVPVHNGVAEFNNVDPGEYYARVVEDTNGNGEYDTGDFDTGRQPELVSYFPNALKLKKNWSIEQAWDIMAYPLDRQKPAAIRKAKFEDEKKKKGGSTQQTETDEEEDEYFDPTANPFDPNQKRRRNNSVNPGNMY